MSLPSYLKNKFKNNDFDSDIAAYLAGKHLEGIQTEEKELKYNYLAVLFLNAGSKIISKKHLFSCLKKFGLKKYYNINKFDFQKWYNSQYEKVDITWFTYYRQDNKWYFSNKTLKVNKYFSSYAQEFSQIRILVKVEEIKAQEKIKDLKNYTYYSREFPPKLKALIMGENNYTCQICGCTRSVLIEKGLHLEIDHIIEWEDGGETSFNNGQTVCSECNKGKHFAKKHKNKIIELENLIN